MKELQEIKELIGAINASSFVDIGRINKAMRKIERLEESLSVEPKAESVEGLLEFIKDETSDSFYDVVDADKLREYIANNLTLPSFKPVMPEDIPESVKAMFLDIRYVEFTQSWFFELYKNIRTALMNSGDKDKVNK